LDRIGEPVQVFYVGTSLINIGSAWVAFSDGLVSMLVPRSVKTLSKDVWLFSSLESMLQAGLPMGTAILTLSHISTNIKVSNKP